MFSRDAYRGVLLGLACGDALGRPVEGEGPDAITDRYGSVVRMYGAGVFGAEPGRTTDETAQAAALARTLIKKGRFDPTAFAAHLVDWYENDAFGVGSMTRRSIQQLRAGESWHHAGKNAWLETEERQNAGNGSIMRCAPLALAYACHDNAKKEPRRIQ